MEDLKDRIEKLEKQIASLSHIQQEGKYFDLKKEDLKGDYEVVVDPNKMVTQIDIEEWEIDRDSQPDDKSDEDIILSKDNTLGKDTNVRTKMVDDNLCKRCHERPIEWADEFCQECWEEYSFGGHGTMNDNSDDIEFSIEVSDSPVAGDEAQCYLVSENYYTKEQAEAVKAFIEKAIKYYKDNHE